jgi:outer membrane protein OmpA-like peptidoglycan-associated protein/DNA-binding beta-propeller fold protein YncE
VKSSARAVSIAVALAVATVLTLAGTARAATFLYVAERGGTTIDQFALDTAGNPTAVGTVAANGPWGLAISPDKRSLYAANNGNGQVAQYDINQTTGTLTPKSPAGVATGAGPAAVAVSPDGHSLYVTNQFANTISQYDVAADGTLSPKSVPTVATAASPGRLIITPDGTSLYSVDRGNNPRTIRQYTIGAQGLLAPKSPATVASPGRPEGLAMSADGTSLYVSSSFGSTLITQWNIAAGTGLLTAKSPATVSGSGNTAGIVLSPDGAHAYLTEGDGVTVLSYDRDAATGNLTQRGGANPSFSSNYPLDSIMSPSGNSLYVTAGPNLDMFDVAADGSLTRKSTPSIVLGSTLHGLATLVLPEAAPPAPTPPATNPGTPAPPAAQHAPGPPRDLEATGGDRTLGLTFRPPASTGTSAITRYEARVGTGAWTRVKTTGAGSLRATITGVENGERFTVRVRARNATGAGQPSDPATARTKTWFTDPRTGVAGRGLIAIPRDPDAYDSDVQRRTKAYARSYRGLVAMDIPDLRGRAMQPGQAATLSDKGLFEFDSDRLTAKGRAEVRGLVRSLRYSEAVRCEGYTDYAGEDDHELDLSRGRSKAVCRALRSYGADVDTSTVGYGGARPVVVGSTPESREGNRRVVVVVTR